MSTPITRRTVLAGTGAAALLSATGVSLADEHDDDEENGLEEDDPMFAAVNTVHASPDAPEVDVYVNGARVLEAVAFRDISDYLVMLEGEYQVQIVPVEDDEMDDDEDNGIGDDDDDDDDDVGMDDDDDDVGMDDDDDDDDDNGFGDDDDDDDNGFGDDDDDDDNGFGDDDDVDLEEDAVIDEQIDVAAGVATAAVVGEVDEGAEQELELLVLDVDIDDLEDGESRVRAVHASPDAPEVDIVADDDPLVEGLAFGDYETVDVEEGEYSLEVREAGEDESVADFDVTLDGGVAYSAFAVGYLEDEDDDNGFGDDDENDDNDNGIGDDEDNGMGEDVDTGFDLLLNIDALTPEAEVEEIPEDDEDDEMDDDDEDNGIDDDDEDNGIDDDDEDDNGFGDDDDDDDNGFGDDDDDDDNGFGDDDDDNGFGDDDDDGI